MNNATWACFDCREAVRRPAYTLTEIACLSCGHPMGYLGDKIRIPAKRQTKAWRELWESIHSSPTPITKTPEWLRSWHTKRLEAAIARLEATPKSASRLQKIRGYRKQLARLTGQTSAEVGD